MARRSRDDAAAALAAHELIALPPKQGLLVLEDVTGALVRVLDEAGETWSSSLPVHSWSRRSPQARTWPTAAGYDVVVIRLPRAREEFDMLLHMAAGALVPAGRLLVAGANDEGIKSSPRFIEPVFGPVKTLATGGHGRLLVALRPEHVAGIGSGFDAWRSAQPLALPWLPDSAESVAWTSYPGVFAHGRVDEGTAFMSRHLVPLAPQAGRGPLRVLDWGAGSGFLAAAVLASVPNTHVTLLDIDGLALDAAARNLEALSAPAVAPDYVQSEGWHNVAPDARWDWIVANPPYHRGKSETLDAVAELVHGARFHLAPAGVLQFVVQRRLPVEPLLRRDFEHAAVVADDGAYRIWQVTASRSR